MEGSRMQVAIIGAGRVGTTLGSCWAQKGHEIIYGVRNPQSEKAQQLLASSPSHVRVASVAEAAGGAQLILLATPWDATQEALQSAGNLAGKIVIDATNPLQSGMDGLTLGWNTSAGEQVAAWAPGARVVKAFNTTGSGNMDNPNYPAGVVTMFICGDDDEAKRAVTTLAEDAGFDVVDAGALTSARYLEPVAMLWIHLAYGMGNGPDIAFKLMRRGS
jgi:hypothetical protein